MSCRASPGLGCQSSARTFTAVPISGLSRANARGASRRVAVCGSSSKGEVTLLDYGAGNVRSVRNAIHKLGYTIKDVRFGHWVELFGAMHVVTCGHGSCGLSNGGGQGGPK